MRKSTPYTTAHFYDVIDDERKRNSRNACKKIERYLYKVFMKYCLFSKIIKTYFRLFSRYFLRLNCVCTPNFTLKPPEGRKMDRNAERVQKKNIQWTLCT